MDEDRADRNEASETATSKHGLGIVLWVFVVLGVYVLSIGPVAGLCSRYQGSNLSDKLNRAARVFYASVILLFDTPVGGPLIRWVDWWVTPNSKVS